jgi:hypothetical protein
VSFTFGLLPHGAVVFGGVKLKWLPSAYVTRWLETGVTLPAGEYPIITPVRGRRKN